MRSARPWRFLLGLEDADEDDCNLQPGCMAKVLAVKAWQALARSTRAAAEISKNEATFIFISQELRNRLTRPHSSRPVVAVVLVGLADKKTWGRPSLQLPERENSLGSRIKAPHAISTPSCRYKEEVYTKEQKLPHEGDYAFAILTTNSSHFSDVLHDPRIAGGGVCSPSRGHRIRWAASTWRWSGCA